MIYLKNNTETQAIYIPRQTVLGGGYIPSTKAYEKGYNDGLEVGKEQQKDKLSNLYVTENGQYEREDGWDVVTVDVPDLNGSYNEGYEQGKTDGIDEQKGKLESINITENGVYSKEDGYNHIEVNVPSYEQGQADLAAKARVLNVTENGTYLSKFSDPIMPTVTGIYTDGTEFHNYAYLEGVSYDSGFMVSEDMKVEIWWKGDVSKTDKNLFGSQVNNFNAIFKIRIPDTAYRFDGEIAMRQVTYLNAESNRWYHFKMSYADGFWVDGVKIGDFSSNISGTPDKLYINSNTNSIFNGVNGYFGMIKITTNGVENIIIPTAEGLKNITTDKMLQVVQNGTYTFTENLPIYGEGELYKTINVNVPDLNGSYDEGKTDGVNEQKSKLETINITKNGTYNREDGYNKIIVNVPDLNGSYDEGYDQGQADIAENAKVLNVTENGVYKTKFSDPIVPELVTGRYADGTNFYNYAELNGKVFNTKIAATVDSRLELWYKGDNVKTDDGWNLIIGAGNYDDTRSFQVRYFAFKNNRLCIEGASRVIIDGWDDTVWHHLIVSETEGVWVDGEKKGDFSLSTYLNGEFFINGIGYDSDGGRTANGTFGMIKIDDVVIIPTADGFQNVNTGELLEVVKNGTYTFTKNLPTYGEGEIYKTINVNVPTVQEQITDYYYCPITITDSGFGENAKSFLVKNENMYGENGWINDDSFVYLPTANNMNEVRTKTPPSSVASFPFDDNAAHYTGALYMNVEQIQMNNVVLPNLYKLELGSGCHTLRMESSNLPNINTLVIRYNGQQLFDYHFGLTQFKNGGKLYVYEGLGNAENLRAALGSEWTIEYL